VYSQRFDLERLLRTNEDDMREHAAWIEVEQDEPVLKTMSPGVPGDNQKLPKHVGFEPDSASSSTRSEFVEEEYEGEDNDEDEYADSSNLDDEVMAIAQSKMETRRRSQSYPPLNGVMVAPPAQQTGRARGRSVHNPKGAARGLGGLHELSDMMRRTPTTYFEADPFGSNPFSSSETLDASQ
jgi:hypothetical protein